MNVNDMFSLMFSTISPVLTLSGILAFTIRMIVILVNMVINAATGRGFSIGGEK